MDLDVEALEKAESQIDRFIEKRESEEQCRAEEFWEAGRQSYAQDRCRRVCAEWIAYHEHLAGVFLVRADHHARERTYYESLLADMHPTTNKGAA